MYDALMHLAYFAAADDCKPKLFGVLKPWYYYLQTSGSNCSITNFHVLNGSDGPSGLLLIALAVISDLLAIAGMVAVIYIIVGAIKYITSQGSPDGTTQARQAIINALIGLAIALIATSLVSFLGNKLGGS